ncbi:Scr1 family TA system antitoxin-like transcriptional regulator, partial [Streptomyces pseudogriseolus]|uniref:Scr1 family TA system antitoxin-like transcriptional regulator n=1 Tax=Streptomyces pseudogriseolus TaxID=36817 RepID=UPI003FA27752
MPVCWESGCPPRRISRLEPYLDRPEPAPTLLKMLVGVQLAGFREDAGLSQDQAARSVGFSGAKLSRIESGKGRRPPTDTDVRALLELYGTDDYEASVLLKLLQRAGEPGWWQRYDKRLMPEWFDRLVGLQEAAATIRTFEIQYVPGLLQTADYTRAVVERGLPNAPASEVQRRVELRMRRAQLLFR